MSKNIKKLTVSAIAMTQLLGVSVAGILPIVALSSAPTIAFAAETGYSEVFELKLKQLTETIEKAKTSSTDGNIKAASSEFSMLYKDAKATDIVRTIETGDVDKQYETLASLIFKHKNSRELTYFFYNELILKFANDTIGQNEKFILLFFTDTTDEGTYDTMAQSMGSFNYFKANFEENSRLPKEKQISLYVDGKSIVQVKNRLQENKPTPETDEDNKAPAPDVEPDKGTEEVPGGDKPIFEDSSNEIIDGEWVEVTYKYYYDENGKLQTKVSKRPTGRLVSDVLVGTQEDIDAWNNAKPMDLGLLEKLKALFRTENENKLSSLTLQYSIDKGEKEPYFYDTGIRVEENGDASYQQYKDVLYQLAVKSGGQLMEDSHKFLVVLEGKTIVIEEKKNKYTKKEIEASMKKFKKVDVRVLKTRIGTTVSLEEQLVSGKVQKVRFKGREVDFKTNPIVEDDRVQLPLAELGSVLGYKSETKNNKLILTKDSQTLVYEDGVKSVIVNGTIINMSTSPTKKGKVLMGDPAELLKSADVKMVWDDEESIVDINKK